MWLVLLRSYQIALLPEVETFSELTFLSQKTRMSSILESNLFLYFSLLSHYGLDCINIFFLPELTVVDSNINGVLFLHCLACSEFVFDPVKWPRVQMDEDFLKLSKMFNAMRSVVRVPDLDPKFKIAILASKQVQIQYNVHLLLCFICVFAY